MEEQTVNDIPDAELLERAVRNCRDPLSRKGMKQMRWVGVMNTFVLGSTYAKQLCQRFGLDQDEKVAR